MNCFECPEYNTGYFIFKDKAGIRKSCSGESMEGILLCKPLASGIRFSDRMAMKPEQIYQELKDLAEKLDVTVSEQSFRASGISVSSGFCVIKGKMHCIIDRNISLHKKTKVLARALHDLPHENLYVVPAVRDVIQKYGHPPDEKRVLPRDDL